MTKQRMRIEDVSEYYDMPIPTIYANVQKGKFPRPLKIGRVARWRREDLEAWEEAQMQERA